MKPLLSRDQVAKAIETLRADGKKPTLVAIHAALGNKGSISTLVKLKAEIDAEAITEQDSEESLKAFREVWAAAVEEGRRQKQAESDELRGALEALISESESKEGEHAAMAARLVATETQRDELLTQLRSANEQITQARAAGEQHATRLADALTKVGDLQGTHAAETAELRDQLSKAKDENHRLALSLARAEGKLER